MKLIQNGPLLIKFAKNKIKIDSIKLIHPVDTSDILSMRSHDLFGIINQVYNSRLCHGIDTRVLYNVELPTCQYYNNEKLRTIYAWLIHKINTKQKELKWDKEQLILRSGLTEEIINRFFKYGDILIKDLVKIFDLLQIALFDLPISWYHPQLSPALVYYVGIYDY